MGGRNRGAVEVVRARCAEVAARARQVRIETPRIPTYAAALNLPKAPVSSTPATGEKAIEAAFWLTLDAINFGSGWFPTLRKRPGASGYLTIAGGLRDRFAAHGPWTAAELGKLSPSELAQAMGQAPDHELMALFASSLHDLSRRLAVGYGGDFLGPVRAAEGSAPALVEILAGWACFADRSLYEGIEVPFLKRAQIAVADLARAGVAEFRDLDRLTMFADNLVPHVLRLDGILSYDPRLVSRIEAGELIAHGSPEEVEIRACALHAVELIAGERPDAIPASIDQALWERGQGATYKAVPRHRSRCTAY